MSVNTINIYRLGDAMIVKSMAMAVIFSLSIIATKVFSQETIYPDFSGNQSEYRNYRTRITNGMRSGPNFFGHYTIITIGCGTGCLFAFVADNNTGDLYDFPFGGEEFSHMNLQFDLKSNEVAVSFEYNPYISVNGQVRTKFAYDKSPCVAKLLRWSDNAFFETSSKEVPRYSRFGCPEARKLFSVNRYGYNLFEMECFPKTVKDNLCDRAQGLQKWYESSIPVRLSQNFEIFGVQSIGAELIIRILWSKTRARIDSILESTGRSKEELKGDLQHKMARSICSTGKTRKFIFAGGKINFSFISNDRMEYLTLTVGGCGDSI